MDNNKMKKELVLKNGIRLNFAVAIFATIATLLLEGIGFLGEFLTSGTIGEYKRRVVTVFASIVAFIWLVFLISIIFTSKIIVDENGIKAKRFGRIIWSLKKENILFCIYSKLHWWAFLCPIESLNDGTLQFKLQSGKISRHYCSLSQRQVDKIKAKFDYTFKDIQTIYEQ